MNGRRYAFIPAVALGVALALACPVAGAQVADDTAGAGPQINPPPAAQAVPARFAPNFRERPRDPFDPQRLKRRPTLDGVVSDAEWDPLYTSTGGAAAGTAYVNWDDDYLYVAARTPAPAWVIFSLDANADGWLRGADNLELTVPPAGEPGAPGMSARILDAAGSKDAPVWNEKVVDPRSIQIVQKPAGGGYVVEIAIPKGIAGLNPRTGGTLSCRMDFGPSGALPMPVEAYEPRLLVDINLVDARTVAAPGITPKLTLDDAQLVPGQPLRANLDLMNQREEQAAVRSVTWQGDGAAADILATLREVNVSPVPGLKSMRRKYSSTLPDTTVPGFYQMTAVAQMDDGRTVSATASFSVVEPFTVDLTTEPDPVAVVGPTELKIIVAIGSAVPGMVRGSVQIETPAGWEVKGKAKKDFVVGRENTTGRTPFFVAVPSTTAAGDYVVNATVTWRGRTWTARRVVSLSKPNEAAK